MQLQLTLSSVMYYFPTNIYRFNVFNNSVPPLGVILNKFCISTSNDQRIVLDKSGKRKTKILAAVGNLTWLSIDRPFAAVTMNDLKAFSYLLYEFIHY